MISLSRKFLSSTKNFVYSDKASWSNDIEAWTFGDQHSQWSADALFETMQKDMPSVIPNEFIKSMSGISRGAVPWPLIIPPSILSEHASGLNSEVELLLEEMGEYSNILQKSRKTLAALKPCKIDESIYQIELRSTASAIIESFKPNEDSFANTPVYSHATSTGRLTVKDGANILGLKKAQRRILQSRFNGGQMMLIDFVSLEPRVLRLLLKGEAPKDIYENISHILDVSRDQAKKATLQLLYGSSISAVSSDVKDLTREKVKEIEKYFDIQKLKSKLSHQLHDDGCIKSWWGRPLKEANNEHLLISHYTQSTAVDVALQGFSLILDKINDANLDIVPCYVIHDAIILDVSPSSLDDLKDIVDDGVDLDMGHFELSYGPAYLDEE
jgi:hypothetical protein